MTPTVLFLSFLGSQPSLAAQMSSLRSDDRVCNTSSKSKWVDMVGPHLLPVGGGRRSFQAGWCLDQTGIFVAGTFLAPLPSVLTQARSLSEVGTGRAARQGDALLSICVSPRVLQSVVLLSDSQLHLFLQSQLSVPEIEACVEGRSPVTVSDAILRYAVSNCGWVQEERQGSSHLAKGDQPKR